MELLPLLFIGVMIIGFYLLIVKPAKTRQLEAQHTIARLAPGQEVMTTAGIYGTITAVTDETVALEVSPGTTLTYAKVAIARILTPTMEVPPDLGNLPDSYGEERP